MKESEADTLQVSPAQNLAELAEVNTYQRGTFRGVYVELNHNGEYESGEDLMGLARRLRDLADELEKWAALHLDK